MTTVKLDPKCAQCHVALESEHVDPDPKDMVSCPVCGVSDTFENVIGEIKEYVLDRRGEAFSGMLERAARRSKYLKYTKSRRPKKVYRFIADIRPQP